MTTDTNQFWNLLTASKLLPQSQLQTLFTEFNSKTSDPSTKALALWLVKSKSISEYQAQVLSAGHDGPFRYGNYTVVGRFEKGQSSLLFEAVHEGSQHPVLLEFFPGNSSQDLKSWQKIEPLVEHASYIDLPQLLSIYEPVVLPHYRFVACQIPDGVRLDEKLPRKARLPWKNACLVFAQVALALNQLHQRGIFHGAVSPRTIWIQKGGLAQLRLNLQTDSEFETPDPEVKESESKFDYLAPELTPESSQATLAGDIYSWSCALVRAISGRTPFAAETIEEIQQRHKHAPLPDLSKYQLPTPLSELIYQCFEKDPRQRPADLNDISRTLFELADQSQDAIRSSTATTLAAYQRTLNQFKPGSEIAVESVPEVDTEKVANPFENLTTGASLNKNPSTVLEKSALAAAAAYRRKQNRWKVPAAVAGTLLMLSAVIGIWAYSASRTSVDTPVTVANANPGTTEVDPATPVTPTNTIDPDRQQRIEISKMDEANRPIVLQKLVDDDRETLWETPTAGAPVEFSGVPAASKLIFVFRPAEVVAQDEGLRVIQSLGPEFRTLVEQFTARSGLELDDIKQVIISLHSTSEFRYEPFFVITTVQPLEKQRLIQLWNRPTPTENEIGQRYFLAGDSGFYFLHHPRDTKPDADPDSVSRFAIGSKNLIAEIADSAGSSALAGSMNVMSNWTDSDRHVNLLYLRNALFNDEGQYLMGSRMRKLNRELSILIPDSIRGGLLSLHLDEGTYVELMFDRNLDLKAEDLKSEMAGQMRQQRDQLTQFVAKIPASSYWDAVRLKYDNMLTDLFRNLRWNVEHGEVVANAWLPPMAAHNLIATSELVLSFSGRSATTQLAVPSGPKTIEELLAVKRDLNIANPPDLNLLMADIQNEINDDFPAMPFKFRIRLLGADLQKDGITKNQRPSELNIQQKSLADILTQIMTAANPSKDITGPDDPACKLIWVVAEDPETPGQQAVLITTRSGAASKSYELPPAFRTQ